MKFSGFKAIAIVLDLENEFWRKAKKPSRCFPEWLLYLVFSESVRTVI